MKKLIVALLIAVMIGLGSYAIAANTMIDTWSFTIISDVGNPYIENMFPIPNAIDVPINTAIRVDILDNHSGIDNATIQVLVKGTLITEGITITPISVEKVVGGLPITATGFSVEITGLTFNYGEVPNVTITVSDNAI